MKTEKSNTPQAFHVMIKPRGAICNLDCAYCYFLFKDRLFPGSDFRMTEELLRAFTRQYMEAQSVPEVTFGWQGGEPTYQYLMPILIEEDNDALIRSESYPENKLARAET